MWGDEELPRWLLKTATSARATPAATGRFTLDCPLPKLRRDQHLDVGVDSPGRGEWRHAGVTLPSA